MPSLPRVLLRTLREPLLLLLVCVVAVGIMEQAFMASLWWVDGSLWDLPLALLLLECLVAWTLALGLWGLTGSVVLTGAAALVVASALPAVNARKARLRLEPLLASDVSYLREPRFLAQYVDGWAWVAAAAVAVLVVAVTVGLVVRRRRRRDVPRDRARTRVRLAAVAVSVASAVLLVNFNAPWSLYRPAFAQAGASWVEWDQMDNFRTNGLFAGIASTMPSAPMVEPRDYDVDAVRARVDDLVDRTREVNRDRAGSLAGANVVVVLSESFADPTGVLADSEPDLIPEYHRLARGHTSGTLVANGFGGGTANMEFELLTGLSTALLAPNARTPFVSVLPRRERLRGLVTPLLEGRASETLHPFEGRFYKRSTSYRTLGFERPRFLDAMRHLDRIDDDPYVSDAAVFDEVVDRIEASEEPLLLNVVTMQNHSPFAGKYDDPATVTGSGDEPLTPGFRQYLTGLRHSDDALGDLARRVDELPEDTVVLYYGDHLPPSWPRSDDDGPKAVERYTTPYVVFGNVPATRAATPAESVGPAQLLERLATTHDAPLTPMQVFLDDLHDEVPALTPLGAHVGGERFVRPADLDRDQRAAVEDYRELQYAALTEPALAKRLFAVPDAG